MTTPNSNGHVPRKTLASQLDRLDGIIDTLAEGLNGAVADAVRDAVSDAVRQAVDQVLQEVLANPQLLRALLGQLAPPTLPTQSEPAASKLTQACTRARRALGIGWCWLRDRTKAACQWLDAKTRALPELVRQSRVALGLQRLRQAGGKTWELRGTVSLALAAGAVIGVVGYLAGPVVSAVALGACGAALTLTAILVAPLVNLRRALKTQPV